MEIQRQITEMRASLAEFVKTFTEKIDQIEKLSQNGIEKVSKTVKEVLKKIFTQTGKLEPVFENGAETISISKKDLLLYFTDKTTKDKKKAKTKVVDSRFIIALTEALSHFADNYVFNFTKAELAVYKNTNSESVSDVNVMKMLSKKILKTSSKEDSLEIIKSYILIMNRLELQPSGQNGELLNNSYANIIEWTEINSGKLFSVYFYWRRWNGFGEVWYLSANVLVIDWNYGYCFLSRNEL